MASDRRWLVVGAGGIGGYFGGLLANAGRNVTFLARGDQLSAMREHGLRVDTVTGSYKIARPRVLESLDGEKPFDVVLFCVKTYSNTAAAKAIAGAVDTDTVVISVQNGMDNERTLSALLPAAKVYPGFAHIVSERVAPGIVRQSGGPCTVVFGDPQDPDSPALSRIADDMRRAKIDATVSRSIERARWEKFVLIVAFAGMTALCRSPIGVILNDPQAMDLYRRCITETVTVAQAGGVDVGTQTADAALNRTEAYRGGQERATSSLLRDLVAGRPTEIESLHGAVVKRAAAHGLDVPVNTLIYSAIRLAQRDD